MGLFIGVVAFLSVTCHAGPGDVDIPFVKIEAGAGAWTHIKDQKLIVLKSDQDYQTYNKTLGRITPTPKVDWGKDQLMAFHFGQAPSTGYGVQVKKLYRTAQGTVVMEILETTPPKGMMQAMHVTYPFVIIKAPIFKETPQIKVVKDTSLPGLDRV